MPGIDYSKPPCWRFRPGQLVTVPTGELGIARNGYELASGALVYPVLVFGHAGHELFHELQLTDPCAPGMH